MNEQQYLQSIGINKDGEYSEDAYVISLTNSNEYGRMFTILEKSDDLDIMEDNQVITEQGSSLMYESESQPFIINLLADFDQDIYQLVVTTIQE